MDENYKQRLREARAAFLHLAEQQAAYGVIAAQAYRALAEAAPVEGHSEEGAARTVAAAQMQKAASAQLDLLQKAETAVQAAIAAVREVLPPAPPSVQLGELRLAAEADAAACRTEGEARAVEVETYMRILGKAVDEERADLTPEETYLLNIVLMGATMASTRRTHTTRRLIQANAALTKGLRRWMSQRGTR